MHPFYTYYLFSMYLLDMLDTTKETKNQEEKQKRLIETDLQMELAGIDCEKTMLTMLKKSEENMERIKNFTRKFRPIKIAVI